MRNICMLLVAWLYCYGMHAQIIDKPNTPHYNADSIRDELDKGPYFTLFKDNYFIGGTSIGHKPTKQNSDVKFQISISQRLTKSKLPFNSFLFIEYTQKAFWNVFEKSLPMVDLNFNPGIGLGHLIIHQNRYIGKAGILIERKRQYLFPQLEPDYFLRSFTYRKKPGNTI